MVKYQYFGIFGHMVGAMENLTIPLDRAHRVVLGTSMESLDVGEVSRSFSKEILFN